MFCIFIGSNVLSIVSDRGQDTPPATGKRQEKVQADGECASGEHQEGATGVLARKANAASGAGLAAGKSISGKSGNRQEEPTTNTKSSGS